MLFDGERLPGCGRLIERQTRRPAAVEIDARTQKKQHGRDGDKRHRGRGRPFQEPSHQIFTRFSGAM